MTELNHVWSQTRPAPHVVAQQTVASTSDRVSRSVDVHCRLFTSGEPQRRVVRPFARGGPIGLCPRTFE